jgi:peptide deformylase
MNSAHTHLMPRLTLKLHPDPVLRNVCMPVETFDSWLSDVIAEMVAIMQRHEGAGLAAPQAGINRRFFIAELDRILLCLINPVMINSTGCESMTEGCLSLPEFSARIERNTAIDVAGYTLQGNRQLHHFDGLWARVVQHEMDHLNGVLICDRTPQPAKR